MKKVLVALSGGVDSSVAAYLLKEQGYEVIGATMRLFVENGKPTDGAEDAEKICKQLDIPFRLVDFKRNFDEEVVQKFVAEYEAGLTPNPCVHCNRHLKFGFLEEKAEELGCDYIATGHYARIVEEDGKYLLKKGKSEKKDQSYVMYTFSQDLLKKCLFPLGEYTKEEVRAIAEKMGLVTAEKEESQDICFIPDGDYVNFLARYQEKAYQEGDIVDTKGNVLGRHKGAVAYTIGQRRGLGLAMQEPVYVVGKDMAKNQVIVGSNEDLFTKELLARNFNWVIEDPKGEVKAVGKIRYSGKEVPCTIIPLEDGWAKVVFEEGQRAVTPGQSVVCYDGDTLIGGGIIEKGVFH